MLYTVLPSDVRQRWNDKLSFDRQHDPASQRHSGDKTRSGATMTPTQAHQITTSTNSTMIDVTEWNGAPEKSTLHKTAIISGAVDSNIAAEGQVTHKAPKYKRRIEDYMAHKWPAWTRLKTVKGVVRQRKKRIGMGIDDDTSETLGAFVLGIKFPITAGNNVRYIVCRMTMSQWMIPSRPNTVVRNTSLHSIGHKLKYATDDNCHP